MYIGIDVGTTCCKCCLYNKNGELSTEYNKEIPLITNNQFIEQDAEIWWETIEEGNNFLLKKTNKPFVKAISVSTQGITVVPVNSNFKPLCNAISWIDRRAESQTEKIGLIFNDRQINEITGIRLNSCYTLPKIMWLKENMPSVFNQSAKFMLPLDFINYKLTGNAVCDYTIAGGTMLFNVTQKKWDNRLLEICDINENKLPQVKAMGSYIGNLSKSASEELGLSQKTLVYLGGQDQKVAAIGSGIDNSTITVSMGTASAISVLGDNNKLGEGFLKFALNDENYINEGAVSTTGASVKWLKGILGLNSYAQMDKLAEEAGGCGGVAFNSILSQSAEISGFNLGHNKGNIIYALYEDICKNINQYVKQIKDIQTIKIFGGLSKSDILCKILAKITQKQVLTLSTAETAALGAAIIASKNKLKAASAQRSYLC